MTENETRTLLDEIAALKVRVSQLEASHPAIAPAELPDPTLPAGAFRSPDGLIRRGDGRIYAAEETDEEYRARVKARAEAAEAEEDAFWGRATTGLPDGLWRDPCGIVRKADGSRALPEIELPGADMRRRA